jgi:hypothetical protein
MRQRLHAAEQRADKAEWQVEELEGAVAAMRLQLTQHAHLASAPWHSSYAAEAVDSAFVHLRCPCTDANTGPSQVRSGSYCLPA